MELMNQAEKHEEAEEYGDPGISSLDAKVPLFLKLTYIILPIWGIIAFMLYWNGSWGWLDRGYWGQLQKAANTTYPFENLENPRNPEWEPSKNYIKTYP